MTVASAYLEDVRAQFRKMKKLAEDALVQVSDDQLLIAGVYRHCPGDEAGLKPGDVITELAGKPVSDLADFFRRTWALGPAGTSIPLTILRDGETLQIPVASAERSSFFRKGTIN